MTNCDGSRLVPAPSIPISASSSLNAFPLPTTTSICPDLSSSTSPLNHSSELPRTTRICQSRVQALSAQDLRPLLGPFSAPRKGGSSSRRHFSLRRSRALTEARVTTRFVLIGMPFYTLLQAPPVSWVPPSPASAIPIPRRPTSLMLSSPHPHANPSAHPLASPHLHIPNHAPLPQPRRRACHHERPARRPQRRHPLLLLLLPPPPPPLPLRNGNPRVTRPRLLRKHQRGLQRRR